MIIKEFEKKCEELSIENLLIMLNGHIEEKKEILRKFFNNISNSEDVEKELLYYYENLLLRENEVLNIISAEIKKRTEK